MQEDILDPCTISLLWIAVIGAVSLIRDRLSTGVHGDTDKFGPIVIHDSEIFSNKSITISVGLGKGQVVLWSLLGILVLQALKRMVPDECILLLPLGTAMLKVLSSHLGVREHVLEKVARFLVALIWVALELFQLVPYIYNLCMDAHPSDVVQSFFWLVVWSPQLLVAVLAALLPLFVVLILPPFFIVSYPIPLMFAEILGSIALSCWLVDGGEWGCFAATVITGHYLMFFWYLTKHSSQGCTHLMACKYGSTYRQRLSECIEAMGLSALFYLPLIVRGLSNVLLPRQDEVAFTRLVKNLEILFAHIMPLMLVQAFVVVGHIWGAKLMLDVSSLPFWKVREWIQLLFAAFVFSWHSGDKLYARIMHDLKLFRGAMHLTTHV